LLPALAGLALLATPASAVTIDWVPIGNPGNTPDTLTNCHHTNCGSVAYNYSIDKYEVTNAQYAEMLNAKAASDPLGLYSASMGTDATLGGITRSGVSGSYTYAVKVGFADMPVTYVSFYDSLRFANWLNNGQGAASTETGAYTLLGGRPTPSNGTTVTRNAGANIVLTSENEWYKAAYYADPGVSAYYSNYPNGTGIFPGCVAPGADTGNSANCAGAVNALTNVGAYGLSVSPYGTYDQGGNVFEWNEENLGGSREYRGGSFASTVDRLAATSLLAGDPTFPSSSVGFRVALVPEPGTGLLVMTGLAGLAARQRRPKKSR
jgi:formylglycine-generating enzyme required for sulfatase activity